MTTVVNRPERLRNCNKFMRLQCLFLVVGLFICGCTASHTSGGKQTPRITEAQAVAIAEKEAVENRRWQNFRVARVRLVDPDTWRILLEQLPSVPGAHASVEVSARDGKIVGWYPGS